MYNTQEHDKFIYTFKAVIYNFQQTQKKNK